MNGSQPEISVALEELKSLSQLDIASDRRISTFSV